MAAVDSLGDLIPMALSELVDPSTRF